MTNIINIWTKRRKTRNKKYQRLKKDNGYGAYDTEVKTNEELFIKSKSISPKINAASIDFHHIFGFLNKKMTIKNTKFTDARRTYLVDDE